MTPPCPTQKIIIGRFGAPHGVKGWLHLYSFTRPTSNIKQYRDWQIQFKQQWQTLHLETLRDHQDHYLVKLEGINDRDAASALTNIDINIEQQQLPSLANDEYYWSDLIGLTVTTQDGHLLGTVTELLETGANDVLVVQGAKRHLIPYTQQVVININLTERSLTVDWDPNY